MRRSDRQEEQEIFGELAKMRSEPAVKLITQLMELRLNRFMFQLISSNSDVTRGQAMECRDFLEKLERQTIDS